MLLLFFKYEKKKTKKLCEGQQVTKPVQVLLRPAQRAAPAVPLRLSSRGQALQQQLNTAKSTELLFLHGVLKSAQTAATDRAFSISKHAVAYLGLHFFPLHRNHIISTSLLHEQYFQSQRGAERNQLEVGKKIRAVTHLS